MKSVTVTAADGGAAPTEVLIGRTITLKAAAVYEDDSPVGTPTVLWASGKPDVATVADGVVTGKTAGSTVITATVDGVTSPELTVTVAPVPVETLTADPAEVTVLEGATVDVTITVNPDDATDKTLDAPSSDHTDIATATANGNVVTITGVKTGTATISVPAHADPTKTVQVPVTVQPVPVESVAFTSTITSGVEGSDVTLTAEVKPDNATDKTLTWESSNTDVAAFTKTGAPKGGKILTLLKKGETTVTVRAGDQSATLGFTVLGLDALTVTATARQGGQTLTVKETLGANLQRRYKITDANAKPAVAYDTVCATADGWLAWPENGEVSGTEGQVATVVDVTVKGANARGKGEATLPDPLA